MNLETKRNAIMNSVASSGGGIELIDTVEIGTPIQNIDIPLDTDSYGTFIFQFDLTYSGNAGNWVYIGVNGTTNFYWSFNNNVVKIPNTTNANNLILAKDLSDNATYINGSPLTTAWANVTTTRFHLYSNNFTGGTVKVYGIKESIITME